MRTLPPISRTWPLVAVLLTGGSLAAHPGGHGKGHVPGPAHAWTNARTGARVEGTLLAVRQGLALVERPDGTSARIPLEQLVPEDLLAATLHQGRVRQMNQPLEAAPPPRTASPAPVWSPGLPWAALALLGAGAWTILPRRRKPTSQPTRAWAAAGAASALVGVLCACGGGGGSTSAPSPSASAVPANDPAVMTAAFAPFSAHVSTHADTQWFYVASDGMPDHSMMVGITSWQQQVPTPQPYTGTNAWQIPLKPVLAASPISARTSLYTGAIALAVNGVPIFNALNNRGDDAYLSGELDQWGGHAGRADDYHYHIAPLHLQATVGTGKALAYALDGFPLYGETEPDGSAVKTLDSLNGHFDSTGGYHYHGTRTYPYINGGMRGEVTVSGDQIIPQPHTTPFRPWLTPLAGAVITGFTQPAPGTYTLTYTQSGATGTVSYVLAGDGTVTFTFVDPGGATRTEVYHR